MKIRLSKALLNQKRASKDLQNLSEMLENCYTLAKVGAWHWDLKNDRLTWSKGLSDILETHSSTIFRQMMPETSTW